MKLKTWLDRNKITQQQFADDIGEKRQLVNNWIKRKNRPSITKAAKVRKATDGAVDFMDWVTL